MGKMAITAMFAVSTVEIKAWLDICHLPSLLPQHDMMRDLALRLASQESIIQRKRLFMPCLEKNIPTEWRRRLTISGLLYKRITPLIFHVYPESCNLLN